MAIAYLTAFGTINFFLRPMSRSKKFQTTSYCLLAVLQASMVFVLGLASVNPEVHQALHAGEGCPHHSCGSSHGEEPEESAPSGAGCAVVLYSDGLVLGAAAVLPSRAVFSRKSPEFPELASQFARAPLSQRSRAPPTVLFA